MTAHAPSWLLGAVLLLTTMAARSAEPCRPTPPPDLCSASPASGGGALKQCVLWHLVQDQCVPHAQAGESPRPCASVDPAQGAAVLKDLVGHLQFLLIPTAPVTGIEDRRLLAADAPNYWDAAWRARGDVDATLRALLHVQPTEAQPLPREDISLAVNSVCGRSQDQLHIHIDWLRPDIRAVLAKHQDAIGPRWSEFPEPLVGHIYRAMRVAQPELTSIDPFRVLAQTVPVGEMGQHTLVVVGATFDGQPGFILLDGRADIAAGDYGSGESLQDHGGASSP